MPVSGQYTVKLNVLVIDDEQDICNLVTNFLSASRYVEVIITAQSALQGHQKMQNQEFDLVIVDYMMQGKDGIQFVIDLKKLLKYKNIKFLLISGALNQEDILKAVHAKISEILVKPFGRKEMLCKMYNMFDLLPESSLLEDNIGDSVEDDWDDTIDWIDLD